MEKKTIKMIDQLTDAIVERIGCNTADVNRDILTQAVGHAFAAGANMAIEANMTDNDNVLARMPMHKFFKC